jgi:hypothetical protein
VAFAQARIVWVVPPERLAASAGELLARVRGEIAARSAAFAAAAEARMKVSAPWTNRTGAARASLSVSADAGATSVTLTYSHGVFYGIYLEFSNGGRYAVVGPSIQADGPLLMGQFGGIL